MENPAIWTKHLTKVFQEKVAVSDVSIDIPYGKITALLGSNGAGKSTTLNMVTGILEPTSGQIKVAGLNFKDHYKEIKLKLGYLTSEMALYQKLTVLENLEFFARLKGMSERDSKKRVDELIEQFDLKDVIDKYFSELSSGQKQRSMVATSIVHDPEILIFDEVTASLDVINAKTVMDFLIEEKRRGKAVLFSTHILSEVEYISDQIVLIEGGSIVEITDYNDLVLKTNSKNITEAFYKKLVSFKQAA